MNRKFNPTKALAGLIDWGIFFVASIMLFLKTAEVMTKFAPSEILGFTGIGALYGLVTALLVEGVLVLAKLSTRYSENSNVWLWNVGLIALTWTISAGAQIVDGILVSGTLEQQPTPVIFLIQTGIPLIPSIILAAVLVKGVLATFPNDDGPKTQPVKAKPQGEALRTRQAFASETDGHPNLRKGQE